jgi:hypothetical protein
MTMSSAFATTANLMPDASCSGRGSQETGNGKSTTLGALMPLAIALAVRFVAAQMTRLFS